MNFSLQPIFIDIIVTFVILFMVVTGYIKGFVVRLYDLMATIVALVMSLFLCGPVGEIFIIHKIEGFASMVGSFVNRIIVFIILFIVAKIIFRLIGLVIKPMLRALVSKIGLLDKTDKILGLILSFFQGCLLVYIVLIMIVSPIYSNGNQTIQQTILAKHILNIIPPVTNTVMEITDDFKAVNEILDNGLSYEKLNGESINAISALLSTLYDANMIDEQKAIETINNYFSNLDTMDTKITMTGAQYQQLQDTLNLFSDSSIDKNRIYNQIIVSE